MKLKSLVILSAFFLVIPMSVQGQNKVGIRAGYQNSIWSDKDGSQPADPLNNFYIGVFKDNKIIQAVHFSIGMEYFQNGYTVNSTDKRVLHILSIPVYGKAKIGPVFGLDGIGANFKVSEKIFINDVASSPTSEQKSKTVDFPMFIGVGAEFWVLTFEIRYHWGLVDINHGLYNRYAQLGAGVSF